ncbi:hypothetical protein BK816_00135 [Boudabousia tangfeifanii]|uniref:adenosylhomocysteine nucleosidase n=1 Tax=Boudabousia tangfeifanii TaxID=1912795 RepID=A0A1D9MI80_9ACTO|nr:5'-methylthioadenosine/S-adenosylhomocysteine nucleosidase [Boudabousia tangfeifanii]AOZ71890.1 hypothetical protein BK816_00135 [Boudabousia tangfeifanii]
MSTNPRPASPVQAVVVCAMPSEVEPFLQLAEGGHQPDLEAPDLQFGRIKMWAVKTASSSLLVVESGIGLANAAAASTLALHLTGAQLLLSAGSAGGLAAKIKVGDVVVSTACRYGTADATAFGYEPGQIPGEPVLFESAESLLAPAKAAGALPGEVISADVFVMSDNVAQFRERFPQALATDMESAAHAQIAHHFGVDFASIRGISDLCGPTADQENHMSAGIVSAASAQVVLAVVDAHAKA